MDQTASQSARRHEDPLCVNKPPIVSPQQWMAAREQIVVKEKVPTRARDDETMGSTWTWLDSTPLGEQETWEDSPEDYPQFPPSSWWNLHNNYAAEPSPASRWVDIVDPAGATAGRTAGRRQKAVTAPERVGRLVRVVPERGGRACRPGTVADSSPISSFPFRAYKRHDGTVANRTGVDVAE